MNKKEKIEKMKAVRSKIDYVDDKSQVAEEEK